MSLRHSYTILAPFYNAIVAGATNSMRRDSLQQLGDVSDKQILLAGYGTGLDNPYLPQGGYYLGLDLTPSMLKRARLHTGMTTPIQLQCGNAMQMPYAPASFDIVVLHLILAVVPEPVKVLSETARVLKPGGKVLLMDKFIRPGQFAPLRRMLNLFVRHIATRTDVVFEEILAQVPALQLRQDTPGLAGGWFRRIILEKDQQLDQP